MKDNEKIKRYVFAAISFCFMIAIAGYINYKYDPEREKDLGQTVYVSSNTDNVEIYKDIMEFENTDELKDDTITTFRKDRDAIYLELSNNYSQIINNPSSSNMMVEEYQEKLTKLIEEKNNVILTENIIKAKGFEDVVIMVTNSEEAHVIIKADEIEEKTIAQIMQTIIDKLNINANNITIEKINT